MALRICHISVLNPSLHPRIFHKLAVSQQKLGHEISIVAQDDREEVYEAKGIKIHPVKKFSRLSLRRIFFPFYQYSRLKKLAADVYVLHSPELLVLGVLLKRSLGAKLIYDVHEDYARTFRAVSHYPGLIGVLLSWLVRTLEKWAVKHLDAVAYAEDCYENILQVPTPKKFFLRNKFIHIGNHASSTQVIPFDRFMLYSGTLAADWGIFRSLDLWIEWNKQEELPFIMAGVTPHEKIVDEIKMRVEKSGLKNRFLLIGGAEHVPYVDIVSLIQNCLFGTALYAIRPYIKGKMPTKFYEYMAFDKPLIYTPDETWDEFNERNKLGFSWEHGEKKVDKLIQNIQEWETHPPTHARTTYSWEGEEEELKRMMNKLADN